VKPAGIVGGSEVTPYSVPWQVAFVSRGSNSPFCGGTLISDRHVLTAAHCTSNNGRYDVIVGEHSITSSSDGTRHSVCRSVDHPNNSGVTNDFAILHLDTPVQIGTRAVPACLPPASFGGDFFDGKTLTVSGWGTLSAGGGSPTVLHSVDVPGMTNAACRNAYSDVSSDMMCAGRARGGIDSCQGDSGGKQNKFMFFEVIQF
jgi:trypsin